MIEVFKLDKNAKTPTRNNHTDVGVDIYSLQDVFIPIGQTKIIKTGVCIKIPEGFVGKIEDRSSLGAKGLRTGAGVIDPGYSGEVGVVIHNFSAGPRRNPVLYENGYQISAGDKIAQLLLVPVDISSIIEVPELWNSERGNKSFGSSG